MKNTLKITTPSDREIVVTRLLNAPRPLVWEALTKPEFIRRWLVLVRKEGNGWRVSNFTEYD